MYRKETRHHPLEGKTIYGWEVLAWEGCRNNKSYYWCRCRCCGQIYLRNANNLLSGRSKRCGECAFSRATYEGEVKTKVSAPTISKELRKKAYEMFEGHCAYCGRSIKYTETEMDYLIPRKFGGKSEIGNLLPSCRICNRKRRNRKLEQFRAGLESIPKVLQRDSGPYRIAKQYGIIRDDVDPKIEFWFEKQSRSSQAEDSDKKSVLAAMDTIAKFCENHSCDDCPMEINCSHQLEPKNWISRENQ